MENAVPEKQPSEPNDLTEVSSADLTDELLSRFDCVILCGMRYNELGPVHDVFYRHYRGSSIACLGLASHMQTFLDSETHDTLEASGDPNA